MERIALDAGGFRREYLVYTPPPAGPVPLVVFLHGTGATAAWADDETGWSLLAARERFVLALPRGMPADPSRLPKFLTNPARWKDEGGGMKDEDDPDRLRSSIHPSSSLPHPSPDDVAFITAVIDDCVTRFGADSRRVFVSGFSNGASMTFRYAAERADRVAAIAPVAGHCRVMNPAPVRPVPTLFVIGSADPLVPLRGGDVRNPWQHRYVRRPPVAETLERWAAAIGCDPVPRAGADSGGVRTDTYFGPVEFRSVLIGGLGHHWPGGKGGFNHRLAGPPSDTLNGTELVWDFFRSRG